MSSLTINQTQYNLDDCWYWAGSVDKDGYGIIGFRRMDGRCTSARAPRVVYENYKEEIPENLQLDHLCRNRICVNPDHLEPVTARVNTLRGNSPSAMNSRKTKCKHGHTLLGLNLYTRKDGRRQCRVCRRKIQGDFRLRKTVTYEFA